MTARVTDHKSKFCPFKSRPRRDLSDEPSPVENDGTDLENIAFQTDSEIALKLFLNFQYQKIDQALGKRSIDPWQKTKVFENLIANMK